MTAPCMSRIWALYHCYLFFFGGGGGGRKIAEGTDNCNACTVSVSVLLKLVSHFCTWPMFHLLVQSTKEQTASLHEDVQVSTFIFFTFCCCCCCCCCCTMLLTLLQLFLYAFCRQLPSPIHTKQKHIPTADNTYNFLPNWAAKAPVKKQNPRHLRQQCMPQKLNGERWQKSAFQVYFWRGEARWTLLSDSFGAKLVTRTLKHVKSSVVRAGGIVVRWSCGYGAGGEFLRPGFDPQSRHIFWRPRIYLSPLWPLTPTGFPLHW